MALPFPGSDPRGEVQAAPHCHRLLSSFTTVCLGIGIVGCFGVVTLKTTKGGWVGLVMTNGFGHCVFKGGVAFGTFFFWT